MVETAGRISLWGIEVFTAIAEEASISAAARRLGASPSSVSQQLTNLETAVATTLIDRSARPLICTPAGELFRRRALTIINEAEQAKAELAAADLAQMSRFRIGVIEDFDADVTPSLLGALAGEWNNTQFLLETGASHRLMDQLDARALDVIITADMGAAPEWAEVHPLMEERFVAVLPKGADPAPDALRTRPLVQYSTRHYMGRQISSHLAEQDFRIPPRYQLDSYHAILAMVASGAGWSILPPLGLLRAKRFLQDIEIAPLPVAPLGRQITLMARKGVYGGLPADVAGRVRSLIDAKIIHPAQSDLPDLGPYLGRLSYPT